MFVICVCVRNGTVVAISPLPHHGWLKEPFEEDVRWDKVVLSADASKDVCRLITFAGDVMKFEPLEPSRHL